MKGKMAVEEGNKKTAPLVGFMAAPLRSHYVSGRIYPDPPPIVGQR